MDVKTQIRQRYPDFSPEKVEELARLLAPPKKKCAGNRPPPCGRGENCKGFKEGYRCGGHDLCSHEDKEIQPGGEQRRWTWA